MPNPLDPINYQNMTMDGPGTGGFGGNMPQSNPYWFPQQQQQQSQPNAGQTVSQVGSDIGAGAKAGKMGGNLISKWMGNGPGSFGGTTLGQVLGKALPVAGAIQGVGGLISGGSPLHNIMSGAESGASIGSIVPGLGTLVGGGIGALVGGVRSLFHGGPSQQELAGRGAQQQGLQAILSAASDQEKQEAQSAMSSPGSPWKNVNDPLALIVMRNQLVKNGVDPNQAVQQSNKYMTDMWNAEKGGKGAVASAFNPIYQSFR